MSCEHHLSRVHGIDFLLMRSLLLTNYGAQLDSATTRNPWHWLKLISNSQGVETCVVIRSCISKYLDSCSEIPSLKREHLEKLLSMTEAEVYEGEREADVLQKQERDEFFQTVNQICLDRFDLLDVELLILARNFPDRFIPFGLFGTFGDFTHRNLRSDSVRFDLAVYRAIEDRELAVRTSVSGGKEPILSRVAFLVPDVETFIEANKILNIACRYGESELFSELDAKGRDIPERRREFLISIVERSTEFRKFFLPLWYSRRCQEAAPEFSKGEGQSWDKALKY